MMSLTMTTPSIDRSLLLIHFDRNTKFHVNAVAPAIRSSITLNVNVKKCDAFCASTCDKTLWVPQELAWDSGDGTSKARFIEGLESIIKAKENQSANDAALQSFEFNKL
jgi:hypothetical protein